MGQRLKAGGSNESTESWPLDHQGQWPVTRPWPFGFVEMNCHKEMESSEISKAFIMREEYVSIDSHGLAQRVSCTLRVL